MSFSAGALVAADPRITGVTGIRGLGFHRLHFSLALELRTHSDRVLELSNLTGEVSAGTSRSGPFSALGRMTPETAWFVETGSFSRAEHLGLLIDLSSEQLEALERLRGGASLVFNFDLRVQVSTKGRKYPGFDKIWFEANLSDWSTVLRELGYLDLLLLAVELPIGAPEQFHQTIKLLRGGHEDLLAGRYDSAVASCRRAMESVGGMAPHESAQGQIWGVITQGKERRAAMTKSERAELVRMAVRHFSHPAHHVGESFSRHDALFILTAAAGVIWEALSQVRADA